MERQHAGVGWRKHWMRTPCSRGAGSFKALGILSALALALPLGTMAQAAGTPWAWGINTYGTLGNGTNTGSNVPVQVSFPGGTIIAAVACGRDHSLALKNDGTVWAWGYNYFGQLGNGTLADSTLPVQVSGLTGVTAIAGGLNHSLALKK